MVETFLRRLALVRNLALGLIFFSLIGGCASLPSDYPRSHSKAMQDTDHTRLGRAIAPRVAENPSVSGFYPLGNGIDAFVARLAFAQAAQRTLDVQYYLFHNDATGLLLAAYLVDAADRGVRVRLLLDDMDMGGRDAGLAAIAQHPNIEIRLFNPFPSRTMRYLNFLSHFGMVTRRMHNKSFIADNQVAIVGGRNIGDEYFEAAEGTNFGDMDVLGIGPIVRDVSDAFDLYWNSELAYPADVLGEPGDPELLRVARERLAEEIEGLQSSAYGQRLRESNLAQRLTEGDIAFHWGPAWLLYDLPEKISTDPDDSSTHLGPELINLIASVETDLIAISPYFVPGKKGADLLRSMVERGVRVTILTNSLATTDVPAVHAGYARYRKTLVEAGVELYEMRPSAHAQEHDSYRMGESQASLHSKTLVFDRKRVLVGSMNLDPRSHLLNTEMGILIDSAELAGRVAKWREEALPDIAWRLELEAVAAPHVPPGQEQRLVWIDGEGGREVRIYERDPEASPWARLQAFVLGLLPIERQL